MGPLCSSGLFILSLRCLSNGKVCYATKHYCILWCLPNSWGEKSLDVLERFRGSSMKVELMSYPCRN